MDKILELAKKIKSCYGDNAYVYVKDTIDKLCDKGISKSCIAKSCFANYGLLVDIINVLTEFEKIIKKL